MMKKRILVVISILLIGNNLYSQRAEQTKQLYPISISFMNESISLPNLAFLKYSFNPAFMIGTEYRLKKVDNHDWHLTGNIGGYYHSGWQGTIFVSSELGYRWKPNRWSLIPRLGLGYSRAYSTTATYGFSNGKFQKVKDTGAGFLLTSFNLNIAYQLSKKENSSELFFTYGFSVELPFNEYAGFHHLVGVGYKFYLVKK